MSSEILNRLITETEEKIQALTNQIAQLQSELDSGKEAVESFREQYNNILTWSEIYDESSMETKKMIMSSLIKSIWVSRDYSIDIDFNISIADFMGDVSPKTKTKEKELAVV